MTRKIYLFFTGIILLGLLLAAGCSSTIPQASTGDIVRVHYTGKLQDGTVFDTSLGSEPLEFTLGRGQLMPSFEQAVIGMQVGETKTFTIPAYQAHGPRRSELIDVVKREQLPEGLEPRVGMQLQSTDADGETVVVTIIEVSDATITIDANSPLAGEDLIFEIELVGIGPLSAKSGPDTSSGSGLTSMSLEQALSSGKPTLAEFGSVSCVPCKQMKPILEELAAEYEGILNVVFVEIYEEKALTQQYGIMAIPTQIIFDSSGNEVTRHMGLWPILEIIAQLKKFGIQ